LPLLSKKEILLDTTLSLGEFDPHVPGAYRNVISYPLNAKQGKDLFVTVNANNPVDIALSDSDGICIKFKDSILSDTIGPIAVSKKGTVALVLGIYRGDTAELSVKAWTE